VVDPTDEAAVAEALLDILTHPTKWEEMSKNGASAAARTPAANELPYPSTLCC